MTIQKTQDGGKLVIALSGRLDTTTAPELEAQLFPIDAGISDLTFDFAELSYLSSAGLRVLLSAQKQMTKQGEMSLCNVSGAIMEIFDVTGFSDIITIK